MPKFIEPITIKLKSGPRPLVFDMESAIEAQRAINEYRKHDPAKSIFTIIDEEFKGVKTLEVDLEVLTIMVWAGLLDSEPKLTRDKVKKQLTNIGDATRKVIMMISACFLNNDETDDDETDSIAAEKKTMPNGTLDSQHSPKFT